MSTYGNTHLYVNAIVFFALETDVPLVRSAFKVLSTVQRNRQNNSGPLGHRWVWSKVEVEEDAIALAVELTVPENLSQNASLSDFCTLEEITALYRFKFNK